MSATMARQGGQVQLQQSDMSLVMKMAKMATAGFSSTAIEETHHLVKCPRAEVQHEIKQAVEISGHQIVIAVIVRHPGMVWETQTNGCLHC
jgi:cell division GTPase FtsZ